MSESEPSDRRTRYMSGHSASGTMVWPRLRVTLRGFVAAGAVIGPDLVGCISDPFCEAGAASGALSAAELALQSAPRCAATRQAVPQ
jgi:hypothetical protein